MLYVNKNSLYCKEDFLKLKEYQIIDILDFRLIIFKIYNSNEYLMSIFINNIKSYMNKLQDLYIKEGIEYYKDFLDKDYRDKCSREVAIFNPLILSLFKIDKNKYYQILNYQSELIRKFGKNKVLKNQNIKTKYIETNVDYYNRFNDKEFCNILRRITFGLNKYTDNEYINWIITNYNYMYGLNKRKLDYGTHEVIKLSKLHIFKS